MDWRIVAAAVAAVGVLTGGTLLATQVQADLDAGLASSVDATPFKSPTSAPLKLNDLKLPKDLPLKIPPGTEISPDLSKMTLPKDLNVDLPGDLDLSGLDLKLPEDFDLQLPEGTIFDPTAGKLELPNGGSLKLPDGRSFDLPPGSGLDLPPELSKTLREQGLPPGVLDAARNMHIEDLPPDLHAKLDPPVFDGPGSLKLPAGTTITLPDGQLLPFAAGALGYAAQYVLPPGTTLDIPFDANSAGGTFPVPQPDPGSARDGTTISGESVDTEITSMPARVRKGEPVTVSGYVRDARTGRPVAGAPVDVFMNESKRAPGTLVGQGHSDGSGTFTIELTLPSEKPAREYQLVNHAVAFVDAAGVAHADGWGDPPFATTASTKLSVSMPARGGLGVPTTITGTLLDNTGAPVASAPITIMSDGRLIARPATDTAGRFAQAYTFTAGSHVVEARSIATPYYEASNIATAAITIDDFAIEIPSLLKIAPGDTLLLSGRVLDKGVPSTDELLKVDAALGNDAFDIRTDGSGRFTATWSTSPDQRAGVYTILYRLPLHNLTRSQTIQIDQTGKFTLDAPALADVELPVRVEVALRSVSGRPLAEQAVRLTLTGPGGTRDLSVTTDAAGGIVNEISALRPTPGSYTLSVRVLNTPNLAAPLVSQRVDLGRFEVDWSAPPTITRAESFEASAVVRFNGAPFANTAVTLDSFGPSQVRTDDKGIVRWSSEVPRVASLGSHTLSLTTDEHPQRTTRMEVVAIPTLAIDAPSSLGDGVPFQTVILLTDDQGDPIRDSGVTLTTVAGGVVQVTNVKTDAAGRWKGPLNVSAPEGTNVTLSARFDASGPYLAADSAQTMSVGAPVARDDSRYAWSLPLVAIAALGGLGAAGYAVTRKRRRRAELTIVPTAAATQQRSSEIELRFDIPEGEPAVWGLHDAIDLVATNHGDAGRFELSWPGGSSVGALAKEAHARTTMRFPQEGEITIHARRQDGAYAPVEASVRIVDYRKETAREFDLFLEKAQKVDASLTRRSTPREIVWAIGSRLGDATHEALEELALVMEFTNYSDRAVAREHYLRFVHAARALDAHLAASRHETEV